MLPSLVSRDPDIESPGLMDGIEGKIDKDTGLLVPAGVVTFTEVVPEGIPDKSTVAVAEVVLTTFALLTTPVPTFTVIGAPNRIPVSVTGNDVPATANGGLTLLSAGSTLIEIE